MAPNERLCLKLFRVSFGWCLEIHSLGLAHTFHFEMELSSLTALSGFAMSGLTPRWSGRVIDKVPSSGRGVRAAQLNR
jgi:hypothetical protein